MSSRKELEKHTVMGIEFTASYHLYYEASLENCFNFPPCYLKLYSILNLGEPNISKLINRLIKVKGELGRKIKKDGRKGWQFHTYLNCKELLPILRRFQGKTPKRPILNWLRTVDDFFPDNAQKTEVVINLDEYRHSHKFDGRLIKGVVTKLLNPKGSHYLEVNCQDILVNGQKSEMRFSGSLDSNCFFTLKDYMFLRQAYKFLYENREIRHKDGFWEKHPCELSMAEFYYTWRSVSFATILDHVHSNFDENSFDISMWQHFATSYNDEKE